MSFRSLLLSALGKQKEAVDGIKKTLFKNLKNPTVWHIYGIIFRKEK